MASLVSSSLWTAPDYSRRGNDPQTHRAEYLVTVDSVIPGAEALDLGRTASTNPVPLRGAPMVWGGYADPSAYALDFEAKPFGTGDNRADWNKQWLIGVTWRPPRPGQDEQPGSFDVSPLLRDKEYLVEWDVEDEHFTEAWNMVAFGPTENAPDRLRRAAGVHGHITNASWEYIGPISIPVNRPILVVAYNVASQSTAISLNSTFRRSINDDAWSVRGLTVAKHKAKFLRATTTPQQTDLGVDYYRVQVRVKISGDPWYHRIPNVGTRVWREDVEKFGAPFGEDGIGREITLNLTGDEFTGAVEALQEQLDVFGTDADGNETIEQAIADLRPVIPYRVYREENFDDLPFD